MGLKNKINEKVGDKIDEFKNKADSLVATVTNKAFDVNLLKAIQKDFHTIIDNIIDMQLSNLYNYQILKLICENNNITIPDYIEKHFKIEN